MKDWTFFLLINIILRSIEVSAERMKASHQYECFLMKLYKITRIVDHRH
jgi:hypothetical protein